MTDREYRAIEANFRRQERLDLPYSHARVGLAPRVASAWREYWRPDPAIGVSADAQAMVTLCGFGLILIPLVCVAAKCCGF